MSKETVSLIDYLSALREGDKAIAEERDRRYAEVAEARAEALRIKEVADEKALNLAREIQHYKDEKANAFREQIAEERGTFLTNEIYSERHEELIRRITSLENTEFSHRGKSEGLSMSAKILLGTITVMTFLIPIVVLIANGVFH